MPSSIKLTILYITYIFYIACITSCNACNEAICASVVSKCMIMNRCDCTLEDCSCCKDCFECLGHLYSECCSCFYLCQQPNNINYSLGRTSNVENLNTPVPALFQHLTKRNDTQERWTSYTFPAFTGTSYNVVLKSDNDSISCSVAFHTKCSSWNNCKRKCQTMGAHSYRWFHDGCCECIRDTCINYGINESKCKYCPPKIDEQLLIDEEEFDDYGQDTDDENYTPEQKRYESFIDMLH